MTSETPELSVVIPAYNEFRRLGPTLDRVIEFLGARGEPDEIIVVDDGSRDGTADFARGRGGPVRVIALERNSGKGAAVRTGVRASRGRRVLFSDADLSTPIEEWDRFAAKLDEGHDIVIGSRSLKQSNVVVRQPWYREKMGRTFNWILRRILPLRFIDTQCGFKAFDGAVARELFRVARVDGFAFDAEVVFLAVRGGYDVVDLPVTWRNDADSRVSPLRHSLQMLRDLVRIRWHHVWGGYALRPRSEIAARSTSATRRA